MPLNAVKQFIKETPIVGNVAVKVHKVLTSAYEPGEHKRQQLYQLTRIPSTENEDAANRSLRQIQNLLNYTKTSQSAYSAKNYPAGYHTIQIGGQSIRGQRDPASRLNQVPIDFRGKTVLDIGCNQGGMLHQLSRDIKHGVGIDFDSRMINVANKISTVKCLANLSFYVFDLEKEQLDLIEDFLPEHSVDVVFLLSVSMWLKNWPDVIDFGARISDAMVFESNGSVEEQAEQKAYLKRTYESVSLLSDSSDDDPRQKKRKLYLCTGRIGKQSDLPHR